MINVLSFIVTTYTAENYSAKLLKTVFFALEDVRIFNDLELNLLLMSKGIISISEWDRYMADYLKEEATELKESELQFFANILESSIVEKKIMTKDQVPNLILVIESMTSNRKIGKFCQYILDSLSYEKQNRNIEHMDISQMNNLNNLREFFIKWVKISYIEDKEKQEK